MNYLVKEKPVRMESKTFHVRTSGSLNLKVRSLALCEEMDIWQVIVFCIYADEPLNYVYVCACVFSFFLAQDRELWAFAMWPQHGAWATVERTDGPNSPSPYFTIQTGNERNKEPERQRTRQRDLIIEMEKTKKKPHHQKGTSLPQSWEDNKKKSEPLRGECCASNI